MMNPHYLDYSYVGTFMQLAWPMLVLFVAWDLYWRGRALWLAAQKKELYWFIALLVVNSVGILPLLYIFVFSKRRA